MKSPDSARSERAFANAVDQAKIVVAGMLTVHRLEHAVGTRLHRQMQIGHQHIEITVRGNQFVVHVARMAGRVAQPCDARNFGESEQQPAKSPCGAVRSHAMIGVDVLAEQRHFAHARRRQPLRFSDDLGNGARNLRTARIGHHTEATELVAAFLHGQKRGDAALADDVRLGRRQMFELILDGKFGLHDARAIGGAHDQVRQSMIALRSEHQIDGGRAPRDFLALSLRDASGDRQQHRATAFFARLLQLSNAADFRIDLFRRLFADMAGVEDDQIGLFHRVRGTVALRRQSVGHTIGIVDVHLATIGADVDFLFIAHQTWNLAFRIQGWSKQIRSATLSSAAGT